MNALLTFYTNPRSRGMIVRWMLEELGVGYDTVPLAYGPEMKADAYRAINPMGKVPAIRHGETVVTEAAAICAYLADAFPQAGLAPLPGDPQRGAWYRWLFFGAGPVEAAVTNRALGFEPTAENGRMIRYGSYDEVVDVLDRLVADGPYIMGERFSAVDVYLGSQIDWGVAFGTLPKRASFEAYAARIRGRAAYRRARELDEALAAAITG